MNKKFQTILNEIHKQNKIKNKIQDSHRIHNLSKKNKDMEIGNVHVLITKSECHFVMFDSVETNHLEIYKNDYVQHKKSVKNKVNHKINKFIYKKKKYK